MFEEVKEMIDSTIYTNGRGEVTAQNVNLAMHGMVDATEEKFGEVDGELKQTEVKITEIKQDITKLGEGGLGGYVLKFPMFIFEFLEIETPEEMFLSDETIEPIVAEFPTLAQPIAELRQHNATTLRKINETIAEGKPMPVVTIDCSALFKEMAEALGETIAENVSMVLNPSVLQLTTNGVESMLVAICNMEEGVSYGFVFIRDICGIEGATFPASVYIPRPSDEPIVNSADALYALGHSGSSYLANNDYYLGKESAYSIMPVSAHESDLGKNMFIRFVVDAEIIEAVINIESGKTTSRVIAKMAPEEVGVIAEGTLSRVNNLTYPYYEILPAEGNAVVSFNIKSTVPWTLYDGQTSLTSGEAGSKSHEYVVGANTLTEPLNHNYRLVATADGEELATLWIEQAAAAAAETTEQVTEG
jgi:hypothetical protein